MPFPLTAQQLGGRIMAERQRKEALAKYYADPRFCLFCSTMLRVKEGQKIAEVRKCKFCNKSCAAKYNNEKKPKRKRKPRLCVGCGVDMANHPKYQNSRKNKYCIDCRESGVPLQNTGMWNNGSGLKIVGNKRKDEVTRHQLGKHARKVLESTNRLQHCACCGYSVHVEVAHIKAVKEFTAETLVRTINQANNLLYLCRNCHWQFDKGPLTINDIFIDNPEKALSVKK